METTKLFDLIDNAYKEDLSSQPNNYVKILLKGAKDLMDGADEIDICAAIYKTCHDSFVVPMSLPAANRKLYEYVLLVLKSVDQKRLRNLNIGYGLIATHFTFGPFN